MPRTNYIVVCYLGERRAKTVSDPGVFIRRHLDFILNNKIEIERISVVLNMDDQSHIEKMSNILDKYKDKLPIKFYMRQNFGMSYGGWADCIDECIEKEPFDEYFLIEDDYAPCHVEFLDIFRSKMVDSVGYVCQRILPGHNQSYSIHAGISCGLLSSEAAEAAYKVHGSSLRVMVSPLYHHGEWSQGNFLNNIMDEGFDIAEVADISSVMFLRKEEVGFSLIEYGNPSLPALLEPIYEL